MNKNPFFRLGKMLKSIICLGPWTDKLSQRMQIPRSVHCLCVCCYVYHLWTLVNVVLCAVFWYVNVFGSKNFISISHISFYFMNEVQKYSCVSGIQTFLYISSFCLFHLNYALESITFRSVSLKRTNHVYISVAVLGLINLSIVSLFFFSTILNRFHIEPLNDRGEKGFHALF